MGFNSGFKGLILIYCHWFSTIFIVVIKKNLDRAWTNFPTIQKTPQNSRHHKGYRKQVPYWVSTNISRHRADFTRHCNMAPGTDWLYFGFGTSRPRCT